MIRHAIQSIDLQEVTDAVARNIKFQVDQLLPSIYTVFTEPNLK